MISPPLAPARLAALMRWRSSTLLPATTSKDSMAITPSWGIRKSPTTSFDVSALRHAGARVGKQQREPYAGRREQRAGGQTARPAGDRPRPGAAASVNPSDPREIPAGLPSCTCTGRTRRSTKRTRRAGSSTPSGIPIGFKTASFTTLGPASTASKAPRSCSIWPTWPAGTTSGTWPTAGFTRTAT